MKTNIFILFLLFCTAAFSQDVPLVDDSNKKTPATGSYYFPQIIRKADSPQLDMSGKKVQIRKGDKITVQYAIKDDIYYTYWSFSNAPNLYKIYNKANKTDPEPFFFKMKKSEFDKLTKPLYKRIKGFTVGAYSIPFRLRGIGGGDNFDFESSLSLQANVVLGFGTRYNKESWFDLSAGLGITGINLTTENTVNPDGVTFEERTANAWTISLGGVLKANRFANVGIFLGWDFLGRNDREVDWIYDGNAWIGLGINVTFNKVETDEPPVSGGKNTSK